MNTLSSKTNESNKFLYQFTAKLNLKILIKMTHGKTKNQNIILINLKYLHLLGMILLI